VTGRVGPRNSYDGNYGSYDALASTHPESTSQRDQEHPFFDDVELVDMDSAVEHHRDWRNPALRHDVQEATTTFAMVEDWSKDSEQGCGCSRKLDNVDDEDYER
jgi:hypothetical protein